MRATHAVAVPTGADIAVTIYDRSTGSSMCAVLDAPAAERLSAALERAVNDVNRRAAAQPAAERP